MKLSKNSSKLSQLVVEDGTWLQNQSQLKQQVKLRDHVLEPYSKEGHPQLER